MALTKPFAENGDKKAIPQTTSDGSVSFDRGFGSFYALPPEEGGLFIDRAQFNQLMYDTTSEILANKQSLNNLSNSTYNKSEVDNLINTKASKILTENLVKTVGASGADFANLRQALEWASQYSYSGGRFTITLNCNADMPIPGVLPFGEAIIIIDGQNNTFNCYNNYFIATDSSAKNITIKNFTLNYNSIANNLYGCAFQFTNTGASLENITININNSNISDNLIVSQQNGFLFISNMIINCIGTSNINKVVGCANISLICSNFVINTDTLNGQIINLFTCGGANMRGNLVNSEKPAFSIDKITTQIQVYDGAIIHCGNRFNDSKLSITPNTLTSAGIIFKS